jgi:hypothetical protein
LAGRLVQPAATDKRKAVLAIAPTCLTWLTLIPGLILICLIFIDCAFIVNLPHHIFQEHLRVAPQNPAEIPDFK